MKRRTFVIGLSLMIAAVVIAAGVTFLNSHKRNQTLVFARNAMLSDLWEASKLDQIEAGSFRTLDKTRNNLTTSEGESYTMLRSVWQDDRVTFDRSWKWTQDNLQRPTDSLFSWQYGERADGTYGILTDLGGQNTASDADTDIALSLVMASARWRDPAYLNSAKKIINDIWEEEVVIIQGKPVLTANNLEQNNRESVLVNPSYFAPYAYKIFAKIDPDHNWKALVDNSYSIIEQSQSLILDKSTSVGLVPNWVVINRTTGDMTAARGANLDSDYGYDAMRTPFRLALDYAWFKDPRDKKILARMNFLSDTWKSNQKILSIYSHDGQIRSTDESPAIYGGNIGYFMLADPNLGTSVYDQKLRNLYDPDAQAWKAQLNYYDDNWAWFGLALYNKSLPNLTGIK